MVFILPGLHLPLFQFDNMCQTRASVDLGQELLHCFFITLSFALDLLLSERMYTAHVWSSTHSTTGRVSDPA